MRSPKRVTRFFEGLLKQPSPTVRYLLPFASIAVVLVLQLGVAFFVPKKADFPYVFFYLMAIFATAWVGGYGPGAITCLITMIGIPLSLCWRKGGTLALPAAAHALIDAYRNTVL